MSQLPSYVKPKIENLESYNDLLWWFVKVGFPHNFKTEDLQNGLHRVYFLGSGKEVFVGRLSEDPKKYPVPAWAEAMHLFSPNFIGTTLGLILEFGVCITPKVEALGSVIVELKSPKYQGVFTLGTFNAQEVQQVYLAAIALAMKEQELRLKVMGGLH